MVYLKQHAQITYSMIDILKNYYGLGIDAVNKCGKILGTIEERHIIEYDFGPTPNILKEEYLDIYEGIQSEILNTTRFDGKLRSKYYIFGEVRQVQE